MVNSWWGFVPFLFCFVLFSAGIFGWGLKARERLGLQESRGAGALLLSTVCAVFFAGLLGHVGLLGAAGKALVMVYLGMGLFFSWQKRSIFLRPLPLWGIVLPVLFLRFLSAYLPQGHGDPLLYHLVGPRLWVQAGKIGLNPNLPNALLASSWEYLYIFPQLLLDLVPAQIFCQWIHLLFGWIGAGLILLHLFPRKTALANSLVLLSALFVPSLQWTSGLAKNDFGVVFWSLGSFWFLRQAFPRRDRTYLALSGLLAGLAVVGKINAVLFIGPAFLFSWIFLGRGFRLSSLFWFASFFFVAAVPFYLRNYFETRNPFFPMFSGLFPSPWVTQTWAKHFADVQPAHGALFSMLLRRIGEFFHQGPEVWFIVGVPLFWIPRFREELRPWRLELLIAATAFLAYALSFGPDSEFRYLGAALTVLGALSGVLLTCLLDLSEPKKWPSYLALIGLLAASKLPTHLLWKLGKIPPGEAHVLTHTAGDSKAWLRAHAKPGELIVLYADNESYYLSKLRVTVLTERPDLDRVTFGVTDFPKFITSLCDVSHAKYILDAREQIGLTKRFPTVAWEKARVFQGAASAVYRLRDLEALFRKELRCE